MRHSNNGSTSPHVACQLSAGGWQPSGTKNKCLWQMLVCRRMQRRMEWLWRQALLAQYAGYCVWGPVSFGSHHTLNVIFINSILAHLSQQGSTALPVPHWVMYLCTCTATAATPVTLHNTIGKMHRKSVRKDRINPPLLLHQDSDCINKPGRTGLQSRTSLSVLAVLYIPCWKEKNRRGFTHYFC